MKLHPPEPSVFGETLSLLVALGIPDLRREDQRHVGFVYRFGEKEAQFLHLAFHCLLLNEEPPTDGYVWVETGLDPINQTLFAAYCQVIAEANQEGQVPYGIDYKSGVFDSLTGKWLCGVEEDGLTCATFLMAVYEAQGLPLIELEGWPSREDDKLWQEKILELLRRYASPEYVQKQREKVGAIRFRPEEVAGAATSPTLPVSFERCLPSAKCLLQALKEPLQASETTQPFTLEAEKAQAKHRSAPKSQK